MKYAQRFLTALLLISFLVAYESPVFTVSAAGSGITISPPLKQITLSPGLIDTTTEVSLQNNTTTKVRLELKLVDLKALGQFGGESLDKAGLPSQYDLADWMTLPGGNTANVGSGESLKINVKITNRTDLTPGGHYGALMITATSASDTKSTLSISQQIVSLIFVKKLGGEQYGLGLSALDLNQSRGRLPELANLTFKNTGNVHVAPRGYIEVTDPNGKLVAKAIINQDSTLVLPGTSRKLAALFQPVADSNVSGKYTVTAYYRYDSQSKFLSKSVSFTRGNFLARNALVALITVFIAVAISTIVFLSLRRKTRRSLH